LYYNFNGGTLENIHFMDAERKKWVQEETSLTRCLLFTFMGVLEK